MAWTRCCTAAALVLSAVAMPATADQSDPLSPLISHAEAFLHREESGGVTLDSRHFLSFPEHLRLTVVPQLLAFCELYRVSPTEVRDLDLVERADFLVRMGANARSGDPADGMLAYALLEAYEVTGNAAYRDAAQPIVNQFLLAPVTGDVNRILMAGLSLAQYHRMTSDPVAATRLSEILLLVARSQHADGSFDHVCDGARDVHYTAWTAMELDLISRAYDDPITARIIDRAQAFLQQRVAGDGTISYQDPLPSGLTAYFFSKAVCTSDYDTRGWVNELGYHALLFDRARDYRYNVMMVRMAALEQQGAWPDKWGYLPPNGDPSYIWSVAPRSVVRTSLVLWTLASIQVRRVSRGQVVYTAPAALPASAPEITASGTSTGVDETPLADALTLAPNPARENAWIALRLARASDVRLAVIDASGRRVRDLLRGALPAGTRMIRWDGRDDAGARAAAGVYFVRLEYDGRVSAKRLVWIEPGR